MDDELIGWLIKFAECFGNDEAGFAAIHQIFERKEVKIF